MARPEFKPTAEQRRQVMTCHAVGMSNRDIATAIGIDEKTLTKHFCYDAVADVLLRNPTTGMRTRRERPCHCAAEQRDELAPPHVGHGSSPRPGVTTSNRRTCALGFPHAQPAAERPASPWGRPEMF